MQDTILHTGIKGFRKIYAKLFRKKFIPSGIIVDADKANDLIYSKLSSGKPCMIARYGATELNSIVNYIGVKRNSKNVLRLIKGEPYQWWWNPAGCDQMQRWSGFFPPTPENLSKFGELMLKDSAQLDILGSWLQPEKHLIDYWKQATTVKLVFLEPWHSSRPWSRILKDKDVLIVHPFAESICSQYEKRDTIFKDSNVLPKFKSLRLIKAVQSLGGGDGQFDDWFDALEWMKSEMDKSHYDIAIIGCGAYGFPLAAHAKRTGHQGVHLGGATQLLFGITGNRWIKEYGMGTEYFDLLPEGAYKKLMTESWVRPDASETPNSAKNVEGACYW